MACPALPVRPLPAGHEHLMWSLTCGHVSPPMVITCSCGGKDVSPRGHKMSTLWPSCAPPASYVPLWPPRVPPVAIACPPMAIMCPYGDHMSPVAITPPWPPCAPLWPSRVPPMAIMAPCCSHGSPPSQDPGPECLAPKDVHRHPTYVWPWWSHVSWGSLSEKGQERVDAGALSDSWAAGLTGALG